MKYLKKFIVHYIIIFLAISNAFFSYTFANSNENKCPACNSTPNEMQMFINFEVEMLWILRWLSEEKQVYWTNKNSWLFNGWALALPTAFYKSTLSKLQNDFDSEFKAIRAANITAVLLEKMAITWIDDSLRSIKILFKDESFVRDYKLLQEIDMAINDVMRDMWTLGIWKSQVSSSVQQEILNLQLKYSKFYWWNNPIFEKLIISQSVKNREIMSFLLQLNSTMKSMLFAIWEETPVLDSYVYDLEDRYSKWNIIVEINEDYKKAVVDAYSCAKISTCNEGLGKSLVDMINRRSFVDSFSSSMTTIKNANKNLKEAVWWNSNKSSEKREGVILTDRQVELLRNTYWLDASILTKEQQERWKQNLEKKETKIESLDSAIKDSMSDVSKENLKIPDYVTTSEFIKESIRVLLTQPREPFARWFKSLFGIWEEKQKMLVDALPLEEKQERLNSIFWQQTLPQSEKNILWANTMQITIDKLLVDKWKDKEYVMIWQNLDTHYFIEIWAYIHLMVENNIPKLINDLWETCMYQCKNHGTENCYAK